MEKEIIFLVEESAEGGYEARALGYSIYTEEESIEGLKKGVVDAVKCYFEESKMPGIIRLRKYFREVLLKVIYAKYCGYTGVIRLWYLPTKEWVESYFYIIKSTSK